MRLLLLLCLLAPAAAATAARAGGGVVIACKDTLPVLCHPYRDAMCGLLKSERLAILVTQVEKVVKELGGWEKKNRAKWRKAILDFESLFKVKVLIGEGVICFFFVRI
jgi:hypothetical protein